MKFFPQTSHIPEGSWCAEYSCRDKASHELKIWPHSKHETDCTKPQIQSQHVCLKVALILLFLVIFHTRLETLFILHGWQNFGGCQFWRWHDIYNEILFWEILFIRLILSIFKMCTSSWWHVLACSKHCACVGKTSLQTVHPQLSTFFFLLCTFTTSV